MGTLHTLQPTKQDVRHLLNQAYDFGFAAGERVGRKETEPTSDRALGIGVLFGVAIGVVLTVAVLGSLSGFFVL